MQTKRLLPKLHAHFQKHGIEPSLFATQWFMTFGLDRCFPFAMGVRLLDLIFFERSLRRARASTPLVHAPLPSGRPCRSRTYPRPAPGRPVFRVAIAMLQHQQHALLQLDDTLQAPAGGSEGW